MKVNQYVPGAAPGDAVTYHALEIQKTLRSAGVECEIFAPAQHVEPACRSWCRDYNEASSNGNTLHLYHFSIGSELSEWLPELDGKKVMIYHNITPHHFFLNFNNEKALAAYEGREQLRELAGKFDLALGDSEYNRKELEAFGFKKTAVLPLFIESNGNVPAAELEKSKEKGYVDFLFVGRLVPNKKYEDILKTFYYYQKTIKLLSRLFLVGPTEGFEKYKAYLESICKELQLENVIFTGRVGEEERNRYYRQADVFLCLSEHEGFCLPLLEAMRFGLPIVAYNAAAVPETLNGTGVLVKEKNHSMIAELIHQIIKNKALRKSIIEKQYERLKNFDRSQVEKKLKEYLGIGS